MLHGKGAFSSGGLHELLAKVGQDRSSLEAEADAFTGRNFLLDEQVSDLRHSNYLGYSRGARTLAEWRAAHNRYLTREICVPGDPMDGSFDLDLDTPEEVAETFRHGWEQSPFTETDGTIDLVRVASVSAIAWLSRAGTVADIQSLADAVLDGKPDARLRMDDVLARASQNADRRPVFAAFWQDVNDLFGADRGGDHPSWAEELRDRLGLAHYSPVAPGETIPVLAFRYPVALIPSPPSVRKRPLVAPCVLDGQFSAAFVPSPAGEWTGFTLHLGSSQLPGAPARREVLHPALRWRVHHLFRSGAIARPVVPERLGDARAMHLLEVRACSERPDYADGTDGDILS